MHRALRIQAAWEKTVLMYRMPREGTDVLADGTSWVGGLPRLGDMDWPHDKFGEPMHHVMQIDLEEVSQDLEIPEIPKSGSLAVFCALGRERTDFEASLRHVKNPGSETKPPDDLAPIRNHTITGYYWRGEDPATLTTFPRWGLHLLPRSESQAGEEIESLHRMRDQDAKDPGYDVVSSLPNGREPSYWHTAQIVARSIHEVFGTEQRIDEFRGLAEKAWQELKNYEDDGVARYRNPERLHAEMVKYTELAEELRAYRCRPEVETRVAELLDWAFANDPWDVLGADDVARLHEEFHPLQRQHRVPPTRVQEFYRFSRSSFATLGSAATETQKVMACAPNEVFARFPKEFRAATDRSRLTWVTPHRMFGTPQIRHLHEMELAERYHPIVQVGFDPQIGMCWGDGSTILIWISPEDLEARNFDAAFSTFNGD